MKENPYTLAFGYPPMELIERTAQAERIIDEFCRERPTNFINLVTGIRGSGKTVFITQIASRIAGKRNWIVVNLNAQRDLLNSLAAKLDSDRTLHSWFQKARISFQVPGVSIDIKGETQIADIEEALRRMLLSIKAHKKRVLITVDEAVNSNDMRVFASAYQIFLREQLPVFLLMTGLFRELYRLKNAPGMTFLERAPRTMLLPLNSNAIAENYAANLSLKKDAALRFAAMSKGYSFAFQVLGYFLWENAKDHNRAITDAQEYLFEFAYQKIWSETSAKDKQVLRAIANVPSGEVLQIRKQLNYTSNQFNPYRDRLLKSGIVYSPGTGILLFALPFFDVFIKQALAD